MSAKIKNCKVCGAEMASNAKSCPACGAKNKKPFYKKPILWILVVLIVVLIAAFSGGTKEEDIDYANPDFTLSADELMDAYSANAVTADEQYKGKVIEVKGKVSNLSEYTVYLSGDSDENWLTSISASLGSEQDELIRRISTGSVVTLTGVCNSTDLTGDIKLDKAKIVEEKSQLSEKPASTEAPDPEEAAKPVEATADGMLADYSSNSVTANDKYKGKNVIVKNCLVSAVEDGHVTIESSDDWEFNNIYAYYQSEEDVKSISKGDRITVKGVCRGDELFGIKITDCTFE